WWGGNGNSTEHTAWLNLKRGVAAPASGSIAVNGKTVAEQIGAQIFIDGWAMVAPRQPELAARLAEQAGKVSHDGTAVHAAMLWAAMEAAAFGSSDIDDLLDTGLRQIPDDCEIARLIADIRAWHRGLPDWRDTRSRIEAAYGYDKYPGNCHVVPNHALMIMAVLYAPHDFQRAQMIVNTSGWDTDCNAGNVGCLLGIMNGLEGLDAGPDWRGPLADRMLISSADGGNSINDAVRQAYYLASLGIELAGGDTPEPPKSGAQFHFSLPGSQQGFRPQEGPALSKLVRVGNTELGASRALAVGYDALGPGQWAAVTTPTFSPPETLRMRTYDLMATPLVYPGQVVTARVVAPAENHGGIDIHLRARVYDEHDQLRDIDSSATRLQPGEDAILEWQLPEVDGQPIAELGVAFQTTGQRADGTLLLDYVRWDGAPSLTLHRPAGDGEFWRMAWVNGVDLFPKRFASAFHISQNRGEGLISHGTRQWTDYEVKTDLVVHLGNYAGVAVRVQGLRRYYGVRVTREGKLQIVRTRDDETTVLVETPFAWQLGESLSFAVQARQGTILASVGGTTVSVEDIGDLALMNGGIGLFVHEGTLSTSAVTVAG
ncbi:MAG TPA: ADP-ribosylglycohydrolase family protein, partial [Candidatus Limnocylindria bacterium]|nr:ADP-ribosylglycohydrolase family protein [Candidatus Limnocylindria bacterium]